jgi:hypothetical protein
LSTALGGNFTILKILGFSVVLDIFYVLVQKDVNYMNIMVGNVGSSLTIFDGTIVYMTNLTKSINIDHYEMFNLTTYSRGYCFFHNAEGDLI